MASRWPHPSLPLAASLITCLATPVAAQSTEGRVHLGLEVPVLVVDVESSDEGGATDFTTVSGGLSVGAGRLNLGLGLGSHVVLGMRVAVASRTLIADDDGGDEQLQQTELSLLPHLEVNLKPEGKLIPFLGPVVGLDLRATEQDGETLGTDLAFRFGLSVGLRYFLADMVAIEPSVIFTYGLGRSEIELGVGTDEETYDQVFLGANIGGALWLGDAARRTERSTEQPPQPVSPVAPAPAPLPEPAAPAPSVEATPLAVEPLPAPEPAEPDATRPEAAQPAPEPPEGAGPPAPPPGTPAPPTP